MNILQSIVKLLEPYIVGIVQAEVASFVPIFLANIERDKQSQANGVSNLAQVVSGELNKNVGESIGESK